MLFIIVVASLALNAHSQSLTEDERQKYRPLSGYLTPDGRIAGVIGEQDASDEKLQQYKSSRRAERVPPPLTYQFSPSDVNSQNIYYQPQISPQITLQPQTEIQAQPRPRIRENYAYQVTPPSIGPKEYEQIVKAAQQTPRLRPNPEKRLPQVEQYLKEVTPTTKTVYQRPNVRYNPPPTARLEAEEPKQAFQFILPDFQQDKPFGGFQFEPQETAKPQLKPQFNLAAYQNALLSQQKLRADENTEDSTPKSAIYVQQNVAKKPTPRPKPIKAKPQTPRPPLSEPTEDFQAQFAKLQQLENHYFPNIQPAAPVKYQQPGPLNPFQKEEISFASPELQFQEEKEPERYQIPVYREKPRVLPKKLVKARPEEPATEQFQYQNPAIKYQQEEQPQQLNKRPIKYYEPKTVRYEPGVENIQREVKYVQSSPEESLVRYQKVNGQIVKLPQSQYQEESIIREVPIRYQSDRQHSDESQQIPEYQDSPYQHQEASAYRPAGNGPAIAYRPTLQNQAPRYFRRPTSYSVIE